MFVFSFQVRLLLTQVPRRLCVCLCQHLPAAVYSISARPVSGMGKPVMDTNLKAPSIRGQSRAAGQKGRGQERRNIFLFTAHLRRRFRCVKFFFGGIGVDRLFGAQRGTYNLPGREHGEGAPRTMALSPFSLSQPLPCNHCLDIVSDNLLYAQRGRGGGVRGEASPALIPPQGSHVLISP